MARAMIYNTTDYPLPIGDKSLPGHEWMPIDDEQVDITSLVQSGSLLINAVTDEDNNNDDNNGENKTDQDDSGNSGDSGTESSLEKPSGKSKGNTSKRS